MIFMSVLARPARLAIVRPIPSFSTVPSLPSRLAQPAIIYLSAFVITRSRRQHMHACAYDRTRELDLNLAFCPQMPAHALRMQSTQLLASAHAGALQSAQGPKFS
jgi:hypothetical protein